MVLSFDKTSMLGCDEAELNEILFSQLISGLYQLFLLIVIETGVSNNSFLQIIIDISQTNIRITQSSGKVHS
jgi:hypothetical protein